MIHQFKKCLGLINDLDHEGNIMYEVERIVKYRVARRTIAH